MDSTTGTGRLLTMTGNRRILSLIAILAVVSIVIIGVTLTLLYNSAFEQQRATLIDTVKSQASLINAVARYDQKATLQLLEENPQYDAFDATLSQLREAHSVHEGLGVTGEFTLARLEGDQIVFLLNHRHHDSDIPQPVSIASSKAEPMRRVLMGESGTVVGLDYRGEIVLAAFEPLKDLDLGIVAKIDLSEVRAPFIRSGLISAGIAVALIFLGAVLFIRIGNPMVRDLMEKEARLSDVISTMPGVVYQFILHNDATISIPYISEAIEKVAGIPASLLIEDATRLYDSLHQDDHAAFKESIGLSAESMVQWEHEFRIVTPSGHIKWISGKANPRRLPDGSTLWNGVISDITERKRLEGERERNRAFMQAVIDGLPDSLLVINRDFTIALANRAVRETFKSKDPVGGCLKCHEVTHNSMTPCDSSTDICPLVKVFESKAMVQVEHIHYDGEGRPVTVEVLAAPIFDEAGDVIQVIETSRDITERRRSEEQLRESEGRFRKAIIDAPLLIMIHAEDGQVIQISKTWTEISGYAHSDIPTIDEWTSRAYGTKMADVKGVIDATFDRDVITDDGAFTVRTKSGDERIWDFRSGPIGKLPDGRRLVVSMATDVTERKLAAKVLKVSEQRLSSHLHNTPIVAIQWNLDFEVVEWNTAAEKVFGYTKNEAMGRHAAGLIVPESAREHVNQVWRGLLENTGGTHSTNENFTKDGRTIVCEWNNTSLIDEFGKVCGVASLVQDITERRRAEEALRESEEKYRTLLESSPYGFEVIDVDGNILFSNPAYQKMVGHTEEELLSMSTLDLLETDEARSQFRAYLPMLVKDQPTPTTYEQKNRTKDGRIVDQLIDWNYRRDSKGHVIGFASVITDITERKRAADSLHASEERFRTQMVQSPLVMEIYDLDGLQIEVNRAYEKLWGFSADTTVNKFNVLKSKEVEETGLMVYVKRAYAGEAVTVPEYVFDPTGATESGGLGRARWLSTKLYPLRDSSGDVSNIVITHEDITDRRQAAESVQKSEEKYRRLFEQSNDPIFVHSLNGKILDINYRACEMLGYSRDQLLSMTLPDLHPESELSKCAEAIRKTERDGSTVFDSHFKTAEGSILKVSISSKTVDVKRGIIQGVVRDITETKRLQDLESRAGRLETAGIIAGQVAHDFNNLLAPLMAYPDFIRDELPEDHPCLEYVDQIEEAAQKIADINKDLLAMGRRGHYNQTVLDLNQVVGNVLTELKPALGSLDCEADLCHELMSIIGGSAQLHRVVSNLLYNAKDAMPESGQITVRTENYYVDDMSIVYGRVPKGEYVKLTVSDTGCGIPDDIVQKIFDPFFSSKKADKKRGSGLGLSVVDAVVHDHRGYIDLETEPGVGTSFYIYFPVTREPIDTQAADETGGGTESILVVDDDAIQREVSSHLLTRLGYKVHSVVSGEAAIEFLRENPHDLVMLDMIMPDGIDGTETYRRILEFSPKQKTIILSGFSESDRVVETQRMGAGAFVQKPISRKTIAAVVRAELDKEPRPTVV